MKNECYCKNFSCISSFFILLKGDVKVKGDVGSKTTCSQQPVTLGDFQFQLRVLIQHCAKQN